MSEAAGALEAAAGSGLLTAGNGRYRITPEGRELLNDMVEQQRAALDTARLEELYESFDQYNSTLKQIVTDWQLRPNDHSDAAYDAAITERLGVLHRNFTTWLGELERVAPGMERYAGRFQAAVEAVESGDHSFVAKPITDSYHTVWFELHEELIALTGRNRAAEAAAGRAE